MLTNVTLHSFPPAQRGDSGGAADSSSGWTATVIWIFQVGLEWCRGVRVVHPEQEADATTNFVLGCQLGVQLQAR